MNKARIMVGGLIAAFVNFAGDGVIHGVFLRQHWMAIAETLHLTGGDPATQFSYYIAYDLGKGILSTLLYALVRPRLGAGPRTAFAAGLIVWALVLPVPILGLIPEQFFGPQFGALWSLYGALPVLAGALAGCAVYKEEAAAAVQPAL